MERELEVLQLISHPNVLQFEGVYCDAKQIYVVTPTRATRSILT